MTFQQFKYPFLFILILLIAACNSQPQIKQSPDSLPEIALKNPIIKKGARTFKNQINYKLDSALTRESMDSILSQFSKDQLAVVYALNRVDASKIKRKSSLIVPECASEEFNAYSPFPETLNFLQCIPQTVLISQRVQAFGLYENGELIKWGPVSTGKLTTPTPNGLHYGNFKAKRKISSVNEDWILPYYFNFMNFEGVGTHQYAMPGYPASHGCVRMAEDDAKFIYNWANMWQLENQQIKQNGTPFMVFGEYNHEGDLPWQQLTQDMNANDINKDELATLENYFEKYQSDPRNFIAASEDNNSKKIY